MWLLVLRNREHRFVLNDKKKKAGRWTSCFGSLLSAGHVKKKENKLHNLGSRGGGGEVNPEGVFREIFPFPLQKSWGYRT